MKFSRRLVIIVGMFLTFTLIFPTYIFSQPEGANATGTGTESTDGGKKVGGDPAATDSQGAGAAGAGAEAGEAATAGVGAGTIAIGAGIAAAAAGIGIAAGGGGGGGGSSTTTTTHH